MILVGYLEENHFFESLVNTLIRYIGPRPLLLVVTLMIVGAISAALVDEVTSILFMTATMIHLTSRFGVNPIPFVIIQVFATNIGSSATVVGNPIGVMIAMRAGLTFQDFLRWASPISLCALLVTIPLSLLYYSKEIRDWKQKMKGKDLEKEEIPSRTEFSAEGHLLHSFYRDNIRIGPACLDRKIFRITEEYSSGWNGLSVCWDQPPSGKGSSKRVSGAKSRLVDPDLLHDAFCFGGNS